MKEATLLACPCSAGADTAWSRRSDGGAAGRVASAEAVLLFSGAEAVAVGGEGSGGAERVDVRKEVGVGAAMTADVQCGDGQATGMVWVDVEDGDSRAGRALEAGNAAMRSPTRRRPKVMSVDG